MLIGRFFFFGNEYKREGHLNVRSQGRIQWNAAAMDVVLLA